MYNNECYWDPPFNLTLESFEMEKVHRQDMKKQIVLGAVFCLGLLVFTMFLSGCVMSMLWYWFVVPTFGVEKLSIPNAIGITLIVQYVTYRSSSDKNEKEKEDDDSPLDTFFRGTGKSLYASGSVLLVGWIVHLFM